MRKKLSDKFEIVDAHTHIIYDGSVENSITNLAKIKNRFGYVSQTVLSLEASCSLGALDEYTLQNPLCIIYKACNPKDRAFGGFWYNISDNKENINHLEQVKLLYNIGFDGIKMIEGKPEVRKALNKSICDESYREAYRFLEDKGMPLLIHAADPEEFWLIDKVPAWAKDSGWFWGDGTYLSQEEIFEEVSQILENHKNLKVILAHFYFLSGNIDKASEMLDKYPLLHFDITAGIEMYHDFSKNPDIWKEFFNKYQDRIIFGTDNYNFPDTTNENNAEIINNIERSFLEKPSSFKGWDNNYMGIGLDEEVLKKIYSDNYLKIVGKEPRKIDKYYAMKYLNEYFLKDDILIHEFLEKIVEIG